MILLETALFGENTFERLRGKDPACPGRCQTRSLQPLADWADLAGGFMKLVAETFKSVG